VQLNEIFAKDVQRPIEGVVKADDVVNLGVEVDEYVLTNDAARGVAPLLEEYTNYTNANGVWISGFFGSGKSHLLKLLAHLLGDVEGQDFERDQVTASFVGKTDDAMLKASLTKAASIPAKSILFNIDQKATLIAKDQRDALLRVFAKVFDESRGYFGDQGHVARFERQLDEEGQWQAFQDAFKDLAGNDWKTRRSSFGLPKVREQVNRAYAQVAGVDIESVGDILATYQATYKLSIEDFADEVKAWLDTKDPNYRLSFFVDEVGQFIADNEQLMLDLQTIAETLDTKCRGRSWVFVTSQEDMEKVIGDQTKRQGNDFSKIQARFKTRVKLTSADVEEVIRKRLLEKNDAGDAELQSIYATEHANFKTLFDFADGAKTYRNFVDESHFVGSYPFVSYQFPMFQAAIEGLSDHNVFEGRNSSVGERSMLAVVQQVAKDIGNVEVGRLATFDHMFAGISASLKAAAQSAILRAERDLPDPDSDITKLAVRLLKALFLVKYVDNFTATPRNLTVLVYDHFGLDLPALSKRVDEALALLEAQTYIQRNGTAYEYLTNEEQEIEKEIKNVDLDASELSNRLFKILNGDILRATKLKYAKNGQDFPFGYKLDDQAHGQQKDLTIHFISPSTAYSSEEIRMQSAGKDELRVVLEADDRVIGDLRLLLQTEKYTKQKQTTALTSSVSSILQSKAIQNSEREKELIERVKRAVGHSKLIINAADIPSASLDAVTRVTDGFQELVTRTYTSLSLLGGMRYSESQIAGAANPEGGMFDADGLSAFTTPGMEILNWVTLRTNQGEQVTVKKITDAFQSKSYGWDLASIEVIIAWLVGSSKLALTLDSNSVKRSEIAMVLRNTQKHQHQVVFPQKSYDAGKVTAFRTFCIDFFDEGNPPTDALELARHGSDKLKGKLDELKALKTATAYPFIAQLEQPIDLLEQVVGKPDEWYLAEFALADELIEAKTNVIDPIHAFLNGQQRWIYDGAAALLATNSGNIAYLPQDSDATVKGLLGDENGFRGNKMNQLKQATNALANQIELVVASNRTNASRAVDGRKEEILASAYFASATDDARASVLNKVDQHLAKINAEPQIAMVRELANSFEETIYPALIDQLASSSKKSDDEDAPPPKQTVAVSTIKADGAPNILETEEDVEKYLAALQVALVATINDGKRISI
jgi:hypothetical protein